MQTYAMKPSYVPARLAFFVFENLCSFKHLEALSTLALRREALFLREACHARAKVCICAKQLQHGQSMRGSAAIFGGNNFFFH